MVVQVLGSCIGHGRPSRPPLLRNSDAGGHNSKWVVLQRSLRCRGRHSYLFPDNRRQVEHSRSLFCVSSMLPNYTLRCGRELTALTFNFSFLHNSVGCCVKKQGFVTVLRPSRNVHVIKCAVRFRPCIDIHMGKVKQIVGSTLKDLTDGSSTLVTNFESDKSAAEFARLYEEDKLAGGHVIMLGADPLSIAAALEALHVYPGGLQVGGGITSENALYYLDKGASHVIVTSFVFSNGKMDLECLRSLVDVVGRERLVLDLSCRKKDGKYAIVTDRWQKFTDVFLNEKTLEFLASYADEFLVHGVDVEGKRLGIDEELVSLLGNLSPIPVTYAGGVNTLEDLERIKIAGLGRVDVTVGSALDIFGGSLAYEDVLTWHHKQHKALTALVE